MKYLSILTGLLLLAGCKQATESSRFHDLKLTVGMNRADVESSVSSLLGEEKRYSLYGAGIRGGIVQYLDGDWVLEVDYKPGSPAPWVETPDGSMQHYPPIDATVLEHKILKNPNKVLDATS